MGPVFAAHHGAYVTRWGPPDRLAVEFSLLRSDKRTAEITGEVRVSWDEPERLLHHARLNLTSTRSRSEVAKHLTERAKGDHIDWVSVLETACLRTIEAYRTGEPATLLRDAQEPEGGGWLLPPLALGRHPSIVFGDGGTGKSYLALAAAIAIHTGNATLLGIAPTTTRRVAYLDWEFDAWEHRQRMRGLLGDDEPDIVYLPCVLPLRDQVERVQAMIRTRGIEFLVLDSVAAACGGEPESAEVALGFFTALRQLGLGSLCIAHTTKSGVDDRPFGSAFWHNMARSTCLVKKQQELSSTRFTIGVFNKKANSGALAAPLGFEFGFAGRRTWITPVSVLDIPTLAQHVPLRFRIEEALKRGPQTIAGLAESLGASTEAVKKAAQRGIGRQFVRLDGGLIALWADER